MEGGCACRLTEDAPARRGALHVDACLFHEVLAAEGKPQLLRHLCCQHNLTWLDAYAAQGVRSSLAECRARGDGACRIDVEGAPKAAS
jgi:hypothetical protein